MQEKPQMMITMVGDTGELTDQSFNQAIWEGLIRLSGEKPDISVNYLSAKMEQIMLI